jgi:hypothetical protein
METIMSYKKIYVFVISLIIGINSLFAFNFSGKIVVPENATAAETTAANELSHYLTLMGYSGIQILSEANAGSLPDGAIWIGPTQKISSSLKKIDDFPPSKATLINNPLLNYISDTSAPSGYAVRLQPGANPASSYTLPLQFGAYSPSVGRICYGKLSSTSIIGPGYHYYKLMDITPNVNDFYFYFFGNWTLQYPTMGNVVNTNGSNVHYEVWASIKFTGPAYPYGDTADPNGIYIERVFLVRDTTVNFNSGQANLNNNPLLSVVSDTDTESGYAVLLSPGSTPESKYSMPLQFGAYSPCLSKRVGSPWTLPAANVTGSGYHYYKLSSFKADCDFYFYFFGNWTLQYPMYDLVAENGPGDYSAWARIKFTGPSYPYGLSTDPNGIYLDRIIMVNDTKPKETIQAQNADLHNNPLFAVVTDYDSSSDYPVLVSPGTNPASSYTLPIEFGSYCTSLSKRLSSATTLTTTDIIGPGYHDYELGTFTPDANNFYLYFFDNWNLQYPMKEVLTTNGPGVTYEIHADIKFTGPAYPYGNTGDPNGIYIDNVRLVPVE